MPYIGRSTDGFGVRNRFLYLASASDTSVSGADANGATLTFTDGAYVDVYLNGVLLKAGTDYNTNTANTIAGLSALAANDEVTVIVYDVFTVGDMVSATSGGTFVGNVTHNGTVTFGSTVSGLDVNGTEIILDADGDTSITADTDDQIDFRIGGSDLMSLTASALNVTGNVEPTGSVRVDDGQYFQAGNSYDLQMYHDGSNSYVEDQGTGDLRVKGSQVRILSDAINLTNAANNEDYITCVADGAVNLRYDGTSCLTTASGGAITVNNGITLSDGDVTIANGHGIDFSAVSTSGSGSASALLDDYEEGTFTPSISVASGSVTLKSGYDLMSYTKIGNLVNIRGRIETNSVSSPSGTATLTGLPFTSSNSLSERSGRSGGQVLHDTFTGLSGESVSYQMSENTTTLVLYEQTPSGVSSLGDNFQTNSLIVFDFSYPAA